MRDVAALAALVLLLALLAGACQAHASASQADPVHGVHEDDVVLDDEDAAFLRLLEDENDEHVDHTLPTSVCHIAAAAIKVPKPCRREGQDELNTFLDRDMPMIGRVFEMREGNPPRIVLLDSHYREVEVHDVSDWTAEQMTTFLMWRGFPRLEKPAAPPSIATQ